MEHLYFHAPQSARTSRSASSLTLMMQPIFLDRSPLAAMLFCTQCILAIMLKTSLRPTPQYQLTRSLILMTMASVVMWHLSRKVHLWSDASRRRRALHPLCLFRKNFFVESTMEMVGVPPMYSLPTAFGLSFRSQHRLVDCLKKRPWVVVMVMMTGTSCDWFPRYRPVFSFPAKRSMPFTPVLISPSPISTLCFVKPKCNPTRRACVEQPRR